MNSIDSIHKQIDARLEEEGKTREDVIRWRRSSYVRNKITAMFSDVSGICIYIDPKDVEAVPKVVPQVAI